MSYHVAAWYFNLLPTPRHSLQAVDTGAHSAAYDSLVMSTPASAPASPINASKCHLSPSCQGEALTSAVGTILQVGSAEEAD